MTEVTDHPAFQQPLKLSLSSDLVGPWTMTKPQPTGIKSPSAAPTTSAAGIIFGKKMPKWKGSDKRGIRHIRIAYRKHVSKYLEILQ